MGISPDPVEKLAKFAVKEDLSFPLLSDADHAVAEAYGAWGEKKNYGKTYEGLIRSTIVVDPDGKVALAQYNVLCRLLGAAIHLGHEVRERHRMAELLHCDPRGARD